MSASAGPARQVCRPGWWRAVTLPCDRDGLTTGVTVHTHRLRALLCLARRAGHGLSIEATRWSKETVAAVGAPDKSSVTVAVETGSLEVPGGNGRAG